MNAERGYSVAVVARYCGPGNVAGSRFRVFRADGSYNDDPDRLTVPYNHGSNDPQVDAVNAYLARKGEGWRGRWVVVGGLGSDYVAVKVPS